MALPWRRRGEDRAPSVSPIKRHGSTPSAVHVPRRPRTRPDVRAAVTETLDVEWPLPGERLPLDEPFDPPTPADRRLAYEPFRRRLRSFLVPGEPVLVLQHRHPVVLAEPALTQLAVLVGIVALSGSLGDLNVLRNALWIGWLVLAVRALWRCLSWTHDWFVVTDRRLLHLHGVFDSKRNMMPLTKVTDMTYERPFWGKAFGYGQFTLESAGQDQALRDIRFVRYPDQTYKILCQELYPPPRFRSDFAGAHLRDGTGQAERTRPRRGRDEAHGGPDADRDR